MKPMLRSADLLFVEGDPMSVSPDKEAARSPAEHIAHREAEGAADDGNSHCRKEP
jgi:hypothetical protein